MYRCISIVLFACLLHTQVQGQQGGSIHIQSENGQEFTALINGLTVQSSDGYLVIPKTTAGNQLIILSFPGTELPEYAFTRSAADTGLSYSLRWGVDNRWSLFDMVDFTLVQGSQATREQVLAAAREPGEARPVTNRQATMAGSAPQTVPVNIRKIFDRSTPGGKDQVYIVVNGTITDTVAIFIPDIDPAQPRQTGKLTGKQLAGEDGAAVRYAMTAVLVRRNRLLP